MEGVDLAPPTLGERCRLTVRVVVQDESEPDHQPASLNHCRVINTTFVQVKGVVDESRLASLDLAVDFAVEDRGTAAPQVAAALMPTALSVCGSTQHTSVVSVRSPRLDSSNTLFDLDARQCFGLQIVLAIVAECRKANKDCRLSMGLVDESLASAVDLLSPRDGDPQAVHAVRARFKPSIGTGDVFSSFTAVDVARDRRPQAAVRQALDVARRHQDKQQCDIFACLTVGFGASAQRLYLIDVASPHRLRFAAAQHDSLSMPFVDGDTLPRPEMILPCLIFGVCARARTTFLLNLPHRCNSEDVQQLRALHSMRSLCTFPSPPAQSRDDSHALAHRLAAEVHQLRNQVNFYSNEAQRVSEGNSTGQALHECITEYRTIRSLLAEKLPEMADSKDRSRSAATAVLRGRLGLLGQLEQEAATRERALHDFHEWLLSIRVLEPVTSAEAVTYGERIKLLEKTVASQKEELERMRRVVRRDMSVLNAEFGVLRQAVEAKTPLECLFRSTLERFAQEAALIAQSDPDLAFGRVSLAIDQLIDKLRYDTALFFGSDATSSKLESDACGHLFRASVDHLRRSLGLPIEPPLRFEDATEEYWREMVMCHYTARAERYKLRCLADGLSLNCARLTSAMDQVVTAAGQLAKSAEEQALAATGSSGPSAVSRAEALVLAEVQSSSPTVLRNLDHRVEIKRLREAVTTLQSRSTRASGIIESLRSAADATEAAMESRFNEGAAEGAVDMAEFVLQRYNAAGAARADVSHTDRASEGGSVDQDATGALVSVRLDEIVATEAAGSSAARRTTRGIRSQVKRGIFSNLVTTVSQDSVQKKNTKQ